MKANLTAENELELIADTKAERLFIHNLFDDLRLRKKHFMPTITKLGMEITLKLEDRLKNVEFTEILSFLDGKIMNCEQMLNSSPNLLDEKTRLKLEGETASLKELRKTFDKWES